MAVAQLASCTLFSGRVDMAAKDLGRGLILMDPPYEPYDEYVAWNFYLLRPSILS